MLEPSKPMPSSNRSAVSSPAGIEKCCHSPGTSTNLKSTISTLFFFTKSNTSLTAISSLLCFFGNRISGKTQLCYHIIIRTASPKLFVGTLIVLAQIEPHALFFVSNAKFHDHLQNEKYQD